MSTYRVQWVFDSLDSVCVLVLLLFFFFSAVYCCFFFFFFLMIRLPPRSTLFLYTTLFRSFGNLKALFERPPQDFWLDTAPFWPDVFVERGVPWRSLVESALSHGLMIAAVWGLSHRSEEHTSELQSHVNLVCRLLLEKKKRH